MDVLVVAFWLCAGLLVWTHLGYPLFMALVARLRPRPVAADDVTPSVALVIVAHNEEAVIGERIENALALDYPPGLLQVVVTSDASSDRTDEIVRSYADRGVRLVACPRGGKTSAQHRAVRDLDCDVIAFSDANCMWQPAALRLLMRCFADEKVAYACGMLKLLRGDGTNQEGAYWRYELWLRAQESRAGSITAGNGAIYAIRRSCFVEIDPRLAHDLSFPHLMVKRGLRAVYEPAAVGVEYPSTNLEDEFRRKVRMLEHSWLAVARGRVFGLRSLGPLYWLEMQSHRLLRYLSGLLHLLLLGLSVALTITDGGIYTVALVLQLVFLGLVVGSVLTRGRIRALALPHYYVLVTWATVVALAGVLSHGVPLVWEKAEGTR